MLIESSSRGSPCPVSSEKVANKSPRYPLCFETVPALILPGQRAIIGTRTPPSYNALLIPRNGPLASKNSALFFPSECGPLSEEKKTIVSRSRPYSLSRASSRPTSRSSLVIIAACPLSGGGQFLFSYI